MEPFRRQPGSQTAILLAGCILACLLQLVAAQGNLTVVSVPPNPTQGENVLLNLQNIQETIEQCEWTSPSGQKIIFTPETKHNIPQTLEVHQNCSLSVKNLKSSDEGNYTVKVTFPSTKQQDQKIRIGYFYLTICDSQRIRVEIQPPRPLAGQDAKLIPKGIPNDYEFCQWTQNTKSGLRTFEDSEEEPKKQPNQQQKIRQHRCSLYLTQLTPEDSGNYSVHVEAFLEPSKEKETREQLKCYRSQIHLKVETSGSTPMKYSAGILAGALLGSLSWASSLSIMPLLFGVLSPFFPKC